MSDAFQGRKLLVLGGTSGMGLETARLVLAQGGSAVIVGHDAGKAEAARAQLAALGPVQAMTADLGSDPGVAALLEVLRGRHADIDLLDRVAAACSAQLADFKRPRELRLVKDFPRSTLEKIAKAELRRMLDAEPEATNP